MILYNSHQSVYSRNYKYHAKPLRFHFHSTHSETSLASLLVSHIQAVGWLDGESDPPHQAIPSEKLMDIH
jgi:hypothetical protein